MDRAVGGKEAAGRTRRAIRIGLCALGLVLIAGGRALGADFANQRRIITGAPQSATERFTFTIQESSPSLRYDLSITMVRGRADLRILDPAGRELLQSGAQICTVTNASVPDSAEPGVYTAEVSTTAAIGEWRFRVYAGPATSVPQSGSRLAVAISLVLMALTFMWFLRTRFKEALEEIRQGKKAYVIFNLLFYGLTAVGMIVVVLNPAVQISLMSQIRASLSSSLPGVVDAYTGGHLAAAISLTFLVNLAFGAFVTVTLPSLVLPFIGVLIALARATIWGLALSPTSAGIAMAMIPHSLTLLVEGQAYILAMFAAYLQGRAFIWPESVGAPTHWKGYLAGLKRTARIYPLIAAVLAIAAIYESLEVIYVVPLLK